MKIGGIDGNVGAGTGAVGMGNSAMDSYSKNLQRQIADAQKKLQELAGDTEMDPETKMKKRQEIQKQISDLNMQLRQHQMEERRKAQQEKQQNPEKNQTGKPEEAAGLSKDNRKAMLSAEGSVKQAKAQGSMAKQMQNEADIKRTEIKLEGGGLSRTSGDSVVVNKKWDEVEGMEQKARSAAVSQASLLTEAQSKLDKANAEGSAGAKKDGKKGKDQDKINAEGGNEIKEAKDLKEAALGGNVDVRL